MKLPNNTIAVSIPDLLKQIAQLKAELERERATVDFYANPENWEPSDLVYDCPVIGEQDLDMSKKNEDLDGEFFSLSGGKLARETQKLRSQADF